jgi:hypothetical protein
VAGNPLLPARCALPQLGDELFRILGHYHDRSTPTEGDDDRAARFQP